MKHAILLAAILASTAAQAQSIKMIARFDDHTVALSDMPCPVAGYGQKTAIYNSYGKNRGVAYGCWRGTRSQVELNWFKVNTQSTPPDIVPALNFDKVED